MAVVIALALGAHAAPAQAKFVHFQSPSRNINCIGAASGSFGSPFVECLVRKNTWPRKRARPASCDLDWDPTTLTLSRRKVFVGSCRGDIGPLCVATADRCSTLAY